MTDHETDPLDGYGMRIGRELHALSELAIEPFDAVAIAHAVAVTHPGSVRLVPIAARGLGRRRWLMLAVLALTSVLLMALWVGVGQQTPGPLTFAPGSIAFVRGGDLYVAKADGSGPVMVATGDAGHGEWIFQFAFAPDRRHLAFVRYGITPSLVLEDPRNEATAVVADCCGRFAWGPGGDRLAVYNHGELTIVTLGGAVLRRITLPEDFERDSKGSFGMSWSPDGRWIAVTGCRGLPTAGCEFDHDWLLISPDGSETRWVPASPADSYRFTTLEWAPDGRIALSLPSPPSVRILPADAGRSLDITVPSPEYADGLLWSPTGSQLAVFGRRSTAEDIGLYLIDPAGSSAALTTDPVLPDGSMGWSVDGTRLLFGGEVGLVDGTQGLWSVDPDGGMPTQLIRDVDGGYGFVVAGNPQ